METISVDSPDIINSIDNAMLFVCSQVLVFVLGLYSRQSDKNSQQDKGKGMLDELAINDNNNICYAVHESSSFS